MEIDNKWLILRTSGRCTLPLAKSLAEDGFEAWAPAETRKIAQRQVTLPILAGFVFVRFSHLVDMLDLAAMPVKPRRGSRGQQPAHANFWLVRTPERIAVAADAALEPLRQRERRLTKPKWAQRAFRKGMMVRAKNGSGGFEGLTGVVQTSSNKVTIVCFGTWFERVEIPTSLLFEDEAYALQTATDTAALKAA